jgi:hypothetical protein
MNVDKGRLFPVAQSFKRLLASFLGDGCAVALGVTSPNLLATARRLEAPRTIWILWKSNKHSTIAKPRSQFVCESAPLVARHGDALLGAI